jgi:transposase-like protein
MANKNYSKEFKLEAVKSYLSGECGGYERTRKLYGLNDKKVLRNWVELYKKYGEACFDIKLRKILSGQSQDKDDRSKMIRLEIENEYLRKILEERESAEKIKKKIRY